MCAFKRGNQSTFGFYHCAFSNVSSNYLPQRKHAHTGYICLAFLHCVFSNVSSNGLPEKMHSHIGCICLAFLHCVFSNDASNCLPEKMHSRIGCIYLTFLQCAFSNVSSNRLPDKILNGIYPPYSSPYNTFIFWSEYMYILAGICLSDPGVPEVQSMGPDLCE